ncbi:glycosyltransferase family 4 protein [Francisella sp. LA112445]|uniref:glycosyltransferase family 4 protein n=1 Tax=Francisella sp. LA112445 TaxID=1395624 RepID=UPI001788BE11|nr:glycosyltransferase family 4 protein [Francisella sp. LA112445]QIW09648.1 glycosyltransferase family 4 protein [Francisella sp. LA112445]
MKVLYFHQHFSTPKGSTGIRSYAMAKALVKEGHDVTMVCGSMNMGETGLNEEFIKGIRKGEVEGINIIEFCLPYSNKLSFYGRIKVFLSFVIKSIKVALKDDYDIVFATTTPLTAGIPGIFAKIFRGKKFVFEVRDLWPELPRAMGVINNRLLLFLMSILEWCSYRCADKLIGLSPGIVDGIAKRGVSRDNIKLIPNGCDLDIFSNPQNTQYIPDGIKNDDFLAIFSGTHGIANGLETLINVAIELKGRPSNNVKIILVGDGMLKKDLQIKAAKYKLDNILFHDPVDKQKLAKLYKRANVGLQILKNIPAFYFGTSPNKFFDYISAGLPVINNYPGWVADLIEENDCGYVVPPDNFKEFSDILINMSENRAELKKMSINSRELANKFDRNKLSSDFVRWVVN